MGKLYWVGGDDEFAVKARARTLAAELSGGDPESDPSLEIIMGDGEGVKFPEIVDKVLSALRTPPFLADRQIVWLRNFSFANELAAAYKGKGAASELAGMLTAELPPEQTILINGAAPDMRKAFGKAVKAAGGAIETLMQSKSGDRNFAESRRMQIQEICRAAGKRIAPAAMQYLEATLGGSSATLNQEMEKLFCYVGDAPEITPEDCRAICSKTPEAVSWSFTGALVERDVRNALSLLDQLLKQGDAELKVLAAVSGEFQRMIQVKEAMAELGITRVNARTFDGIPEAAKKAHPGNMLLKLHPYRAYKTCESALRFRDAELMGALNAVLKANRALVSGGGNSRWIMEQLVLDIVGK